MSESLSGEERNLILLFAGFLCEATHDHRDDGCDTNLTFAEHFFRAFNADPATFRAEIAPGREPLREQSDVEGGPV